MSQPQMKPKRLDHVITEHEYAAEVQSIERQNIGKTATDRSMKAGHATPKGFTSPKKSGSSIKGVDWSSLSSLGKQRGGRRAITLGEALQAAGAANVGVRLSPSDAAAIKAAEDRAAQLSPPSGPTSPTSAVIGPSGARPRFLISGCTASGVVTPVTAAGTAGGGATASAGPPGLSLGEQAVRLTRSQAVHTLDEALQGASLVVKADVAVTPDIARAALQAEREEGGGKVRQAGVAAVLESAAAENVKRRVV